MKRDYSTFKIEIVKFSEVDVIRTSSGEYSKDVIISNEDFGNAIFGRFFD